MKKVEFEISIEGSQGRQYVEIKREGIVGSPELNGCGQEDILNKFLNRFHRDSLSQDNNPGKKISFCALRSIKCNFRYKLKLPLGHSSVACLMPCRSA